MSDLVRVASLSFTTACTVGLELLMVPVGLTEVIVSLPLEPPGPAPLKPPALLAPLLLPPALLFPIDLSASRLLRLLTRTPLLAGQIRRFIMPLSGRFAANSTPASKSRSPARRGVEGSSLSNPQRYAKPADYFG